MKIFIKRFPWILGSILALTSIPKPDEESLEDILNELESKKRKPKLDYSKYAPFGWQRLTNEQRNVLQEMIYRFLEINKSKK